LATATGRASGGLARATWASRKRARLVEPLLQDGLAVVLSTQELVVPVFGPGSGRPEYQSVDARIFGIGLPPHLNWPVPRRVRARLFIMTA
jgi:hypothetical protein